MYFMGLVHPITDKSVFDAIEIKAGQLKGDVNRKLICEPWNGRVSLLIMPVCRTDEVVVAEQYKQFDARDDIDDLKGDFIAHMQELYEMQITHDALYSISVQLSEGHPQVSMISEMLAA